MNGLVQFNLCTLSDEELLKKVDKLTDTMFQNRKIPDRQIPARPNEDYDLLVGELISRFHKRIAFNSVSAEEILEPYVENFITIKDSNIMATGVLKHNAIKAMEIYSNKYQEEISRLKFMVDNGLGYKDMENDV